MPVGAAFIRPAPLEQRAWYRAYRWAWLPSDTVAALLLTAIAIPEQMATAGLLGLPPLTGLIAFIAGTLVFALFGRNAVLSVGADSTIAPIMAAALVAVAATGTPDYLGAVSTLTLLIGVLLVLTAPLRLGWIAVLLSVPVTTGFLAGIAIRIVGGQIPAILAITAPHLQSLIANGDFGAVLAQLHPWALGLTLAVLAISLIADKISALLPGTLIALVASAFVAWRFDLPAHGVAVLGAMPVPVVMVHMPTTDVDAILHLFPYALIVALICAIQTAAVLQSYGNAPQSSDATSGDFAAIGGGALLAGLLGGFAVNASPPRTAVVAESGGKTQAAGLISIALTIIFIAFGRGALALVPQAALAGVLIFIAVRIFRVSQMRSILHRAPSEFVLMLVSIAFVALLPIYYGVTLSIGLSFLHGIYVFARPKCGALTRVPGTTIWWSLDHHEQGENEPGVLVFACGAPLSFVNADYLVAQIDETMAMMASPCRLLVIEATGIIDIDFSGAQSLIRAITDWHASGITVALARMASPRARKQAKRTGLLAAIGEDHVFMSVETAIAAWRPTSP